MTFHPLREKCSGQAGLSGSLPPCAETLAGEDGAMASFAQRLTAEIQGERIQDCPFFDFQKGKTGKEWTEIKISGIKIMPLS